MGRNWSHQKHNRLHNIWYHLTHNFQNEPPPLQPISDPHSPFLSFIMNIIVVLIQLANFVDYCGLIQHCCNIIVIGGSILSATVNIFPLKDEAILCHMVELPTHQTMHSFCPRCSLLFSLVTWFFCNLLLCSAHCNLKPRLSPFIFLWTSRLVWCQSGQKHMV